MKITYGEVNNRVLKKRDTWVRRLLCDPVTIPATYLLVNYTRTTPLQLTIGTFFTWMAAAVAFSLGSLLLGVVLYFVGFLLDGTDGKLMRAKLGNDTFRGTLDFLLDDIACIAVTIGIALHAWDMPLILLMLMWVNLHFLDMSITSTMYRLRAQAGITAEWIVGSDIGETRGLTGWVIHTYELLVHRLRNLRTYPNPTVGEAAFLIFIIGPLLWYLTNNICWMYLAIGGGIICTLPETIGAGIVVYVLAKKK
jgi:phosphatidylglycerophosphate synthase